MANTRVADGRATRLYTGRAVAGQIGVSESFIQAMKWVAESEGKPLFSHGRFTTTKAVMDWLAKHPDFRFAQAYPRRTSASRVKSPQSSRVDKSDAPGLTRG